MKLHSLTIAAFGPFADSQTIDFDDVTSGGLFLVHGATGSGKTTILDAVCFAIYGKVPGSRAGQRDSLRSDHAPVGTRPFVRLEFTLGGRRLRIERVLAHQAPKRRGKGLTERKATQQLDERTEAGWATVSTRPDEIGDLIDQLVGMRVDQFAQVVLLPQGEFAQFLRATPDERSQVLRRLFDIQRFEDIERWFVEERHRLTTRFVECDNDLHNALTRAETAVAELDPDTSVSDWDRSDHAALVDSIGRLRARIDTRMTEAVVREDRARIAATRAETALADGMTARDWRARATRASAQLDDLAAGTTARSLVKAKLADARRAAAVKPHLDVAGQADRAHGRAVRQFEQARGELDDLGLPSGLTVESITSRDHEVTALETAAAEVRRSAQAASRRRDLASRAGETLNAATRAVERSTAQAQAADSAHKDAASRLAAAEARAAIMQRWSRCVESVADLTRSTAELAARAAVLRSAVDTARQAQDHSSGLRLRRIAGMAAELAGELSDGAPCPVCGSTEHPDVALPGPDAVDAGQIAAADSAAEQARLAAESAHQRHGQATSHTAMSRATAETALRDLRSALSGPTALQAGIIDHALPGWLTGDEPIGSAGNAQLVAIGEELERLPDRFFPGAESAADAQTQFETRTKANQDAIDALRAAQEARTAAVTAATAADDAAAEAQVEREQAEATLTSALDTHASCPCALDAVTLSGSVGELCAAAEAIVIRHRTAEVAVSALDRHASAVGLASSHREETQAALEAALADSGFADVVTATAAVLPPDEIDRLDAELTEAESRRAAAQGVLDLPEVAAALASPPPDIDALDVVLATARSAVSSARDEVNATRRAIEAMDRLITEATQIVARSASLGDQLAPITRLADAFTGSGDNVMRMRLTSYVLAARLETVTHLANEHLDRMSEGRFQLAHSDERESHRRLSGLGLVINDAWTGTSRSTATLSGGESFMASLALALGLGDAVRHEAGGRQLQTLLVDEGFGSLDDESLEAVLGVLDDLRAGGRDVGLVSHVPELKARIPHRLEVLKTDTGSRVTAHFDAATSVA